MNLKPIKNIYFVGIGGIGMSALAHYFQANGKAVLGYDKTPSKITSGLQDKGVNIIYESSLDQLESNDLSPNSTLVVYTPAIPKSNIILNYFISNGFKVLKRAQVLGLITQDTFCMAVAGTHGKTTTSSILGHLLKATGQKATSFLGGISENYSSNLIQNGNELQLLRPMNLTALFWH